jgi:bifunctional non-homologous end joining protein LigD
MPLARFDAPFEHPDWIFEPKFDGFRAVAYIEGGACRLVSRNRNAFKTFEPLAQAIAQDLADRSAILDGEIVRPGPDGRPMFHELMRRRGPFCFYPFDLLWLDGGDLRDRPLLERKRLLRKLLPRHPKSVLYVDHVASGTDLFQVICDRDMEGGCRETGTRQVYARRDDLGQNQELALQPGGRTPGLLRQSTPIGQPGPIRIPRHSVR